MVGQFVEAIGGGDGRRAKIVAFLVEPGAQFVEVLGGVAEKVDIHRRIRIRIQVAVQGGRCVDVAQVGVLGEESAEAGRRNSGP